MRRAARVTGRGALAIAAMAFLAANLLHGLDHLRQGIDGVDIVVKAGGAVITLAAVVTVLLAVRRHPRAPLVAVVVGFASAVLVAASHLAPHWSVLSDSYVDDVEVDALSWAVAVLEVVTAFVLGVVAAQRRRRTEQLPSSGSRSTDEAPELRAHVAAVAHPRDRA